MRPVMLVLLAGIYALAAAPVAVAAGTFQSNDPLLNAIWTSGVQTADDMLAPGGQETDALGRPCATTGALVILDGLVRDRCPYIGDEAVIDRTFDVSNPHFAVQQNMLRWFASHQHSDGAIPSSPLYGGTLVLFDYNAYWITTLYNYVLYSGDLGLARTLLPNLKKLIDGWYVAHVQPSGLLVNDLGDNDYAYIRRHGGVVAYFNAQYVYALKQAVQVASWIGDASAAARWSAQASRTSAAFSKAFWDDKAGAFEDTTVDSTTHPEDGNSFAVLAGVGTRAQQLSALNYLEAHDAYSYGNSICDSQTWDDPNWGYQANLRVYPFIGFFEAQARYQVGLDVSALNMIRREWGYMVENGPRTTDWETIGPYGGAPTDSHESWDAGWSSGGAPLLTQYVLGVAPTSPGFTTFTVIPHPGDLAWAHGEVPTPKGAIHVSWKIVQGELALTVTAPAGEHWEKSPLGTVTRAKPSAKAKPRSTRR